METAIRTFATNERQRLAQTMAPRDIAACADETFHPEICLVAIEPVSNFILLEQYADRRDSQTWNDALSQALVGLPVKVIQVTSDEGKGLVTCVRQALGAHHGPDLFHIQQELSHATSVALASQVRQATDLQAVATAELQGHDTAHDTESAWSEAVEQAAQKRLTHASQRQERARTAIRGLSQACHPIDLQTGAWRDPTQVGDDFATHMADIQAVSREAALPERCCKGIAKAQRVLPAMVHSITFFQQQVARQLAALELAPLEVSVVREYLLPAAYLTRVADKAISAETRHQLRQQAAQLHAHADFLFSSVNADQGARLERAAQDGADIFQRSSSCVEGRNGQLALRHHSLHAISDTRLEALTAVHNYFIHRPDGSTAAERFFGAKPANLFHWLLDHLHMPARPAKKRADARLVN